MNMIKFLTINKLIYLLGLLSYMLAFNIYSKPNWKQCLLDQSLYKDPHYQFCYPIMLYESGQLGRMRLYGNYHSSNTLIKPEFPPHECFMKEEPGYNIPQDPVAALIQWLFLSPDGTNLARNERAGDPVGKMTLEQLNQIIQLVVTHQEITNQKVSNIIKPISSRQEEKCRQFAFILQAACEYDRIQTDLLYPKNIVCYLLMAFGYCIADRPEDLFRLTSIFKPDAFTLWRAQEQQAFSLTQYERDIKAFVQRLTQGGSVSPQEIMMYTLGFREFYCAPNPLIYRKIFTGKKDQKTIPEYYDCGETSLRNVIYLLLMTAGRIDDVTIEELSSKIPTKTPHLQQVIHYISKYRALDGSMDAYEDWAKCTMKLNQSPESPEAISYVIRPHQVEIDAGMINMMKVVGALFPVGALQERFMGSEIRQQIRQLPAKFDELCKLLEHSEFKVDWVCKATGTKEIHEDFGDIVFFRSGKQWLTWNFQRGHFSVEANPESIAEYWGHSVTLDNPNLSNDDILQLQLASIQNINPSDFKPYFLWNVVVSNSVTATVFIRYFALMPNPLHYAALLHMLSYRFPNVLGEESIAMMTRLCIFNPTVAAILFPGEFEMFKSRVLHSDSLTQLLRVCSKEEVQLILTALPTWFPSIYSSRILPILKDESVRTLIQSHAFSQARCVITKLEQSGMDVELGFYYDKSSVRGFFYATDTYTRYSDRNQDPQDVAYIIEWLIAKYKKHYGITPSTTSYPSEWDEAMCSAFEQAVESYDDLVVGVLLKSGVWNHKMVKKVCTGYNPLEAKEEYTEIDLEDLLRVTISSRMYHNKEPEILQRLKRIETMLSEHEKPWKH